MSVTKKLRVKIFERDNYTCKWCGEKDKSGDLLLPAHIRTASLCGDDRESNLITLCRHCYNHVSNNEIMRRFETLENKKEFGDLFRQRVEGYGEYVNHIKQVFSNNGLTGTRPQIDRFVKKCLTTEEELEEFKTELKENPQRARQTMRKCLAKNVTYSEYKKMAQNVVER